ncbi:MAG TPA: hypothetical protein VGC04_13445 [Cellulomonas sp.]
MFANVTTAQTLASRRAAELDRRNEILRRRAARPATPPTCAAPSSRGHAAQVLQALHLARTTCTAPVR